MRPRPESSKHRFKLRDATLLDHQLTEDLMGGFSILDTPETSLNWLQSMWSLHGHFADCVDTVSIRFGLTAHQKNLLKAISKDIKTLTGSNPIPVDPSNATRSKDEMIGVAYTIEGSALGATILKKRWTQAQPVSTFYLDAMSIASKTRWQIFTNALEDQVEDIDATIKGAKSAFQYLQDAFNSERFDQSIAKKFG